MTDDAGREALETALAGLGEHELFACDPALADTAAFCAAYGFALEDSANTIIVAGKADPPVYAACVVLASHRLDVNRSVRARLGTRKASFASAEETRALTGHEIGGVTAFGLPDGLPVLVDAAVMTRERIVLGGGTRSWKVLAPPSLLLALAGCRDRRGPREPGPAARRLDGGHALDVMTPALSEADPRTCHASHGAAVYAHPDGPFTCGDFRVRSIDDDVTAPTPLQAPRGGGRRPNASPPSTVGPSSVGCPAQYRLGMRRRGDAGMRTSEGSRTWPDPQHHQTGPPGERARHGSGDRGVRRPRVR